MWDCYPAPLTGAERKWGADLSTNRQDDTWYYNEVPNDGCFLLEGPLPSLSNWICMNQITYVNFLSLLKILSRSLPHNSGSQMSEISLSGLKIKSDLYLSLEVLGDNFFPSLSSLLETIPIHGSYPSSISKASKSPLYSLTSWVFCLPLKDLLRTPTQGLQWLQGEYVDN